MMHISIKLHQFRTRNF